MVPFRLFLHGQILTKMSIRFYTNCELEPGSFVLQGPEAHHLAHVCRIGEGDEVVLFNGDGAEYPAIVLSAKKKNVTLEVLRRKRTDRELSFQLEVAAPLPKGDRAQFMIEKLTEIGVSRFVPLRTERSVVHPQDNKLEKLQRYVIEASKQCRRNVLMEIVRLTKLGEYCRQLHQGGPALVAHPSTQNVPAIPLVQVVRIPQTNVAVLVGPEGGFTDDEIQMTISEGCELVDLGPRILRVETAALTLAGWWSQVPGD